MVLIGRSCFLQCLGRRTFPRAGRRAVGTGAHTVCIAGLCSFGQEMQPKRCGQAGAPRTLCQQEAGDSCYHPPVPTWLRHRLQDTSLTICPKG